MIIQTFVCHFNVKGVQISEFVWISKLSDKYTIVSYMKLMFLHVMVNQLLGRLIISHLLVCFSIH